MCKCVMTTLSDSKPIWARPYIGPIASPHYNYPEKQMPY